MVMVRFIRMLLTMISLIKGAASLDAAEKAHEGETVFYLASDGNDQWSGRTASANVERSDGPLRSFIAARDNSAAPCHRPTRARHATGPRWYVFLDAPLLIETGQLGLGPSTGSA